MTGIELALWVTSLLALAGAPWGLPQRRRWSWGMVATIVALVCIDALSGDRRWQILGVWALAIAAVLRCLYRLKRPAERRRRWLSWAARAVAVVVGLLVAIPPTALPLFELPPPDGSYPVGVRQLVIHDSRPEQWTEDPHDQRQIPVRVWYPAVASAADGPFVPYATVGETRQLVESNTRKRNFAVALLDHFSLVSTHSVADVAPADGRFPLVLFNHGFNGTLGQNTQLVEALASRGYVVVSIGHPYAAGGLEFPDGRTVGTVDVRLWSKIPPEETARVIERFSTASDATSFQAAVKQMLEANPVFNRFLEDWVADVRTVDAAIARGELGALTAHVDSRNLAVIGHSFGGATAAVACGELPACRAAINIDGLQFGPEGRYAVTRPLMMIYSDQMNPHFLVNDFRYEEAGGRIEAVRMLETGHLDLSDLAYVLGSPYKRRLPRNGAFGPVDARQVQAQLTDCVQTFLDHHLRDGHGNLQALLQRHPGVRAHRLPETPAGGATGNVE